MAGSARVSMQTPRNVLKLETALTVHIKSLEEEEEEEDGFVVLILFTHNLQACSVCLSVSLCLSLFGLI